MHLFNIFLSQATNAKVPNPFYARRIPVHVPKVNENNELVVNCEAKHVDVEILYDEFHDRDMEACYDGFETRKCVLEERNVFCSSYNVFILVSK